MRKTRYVLYVVLLSLCLMIPINAKAKQNTSNSPYTVGYVGMDPSGYLKYKVTSATPFSDSYGEYCGTAEVVGVGTMTTVVSFIINNEVYIGDSSESYRYKVTSIAPKAFKGNRMMKSMTINPDSSIKVIPKGMCQNCKKLERLYIKTTAVKTIKKSAFKGCKKLTTLYGAKKSYQNKVKKAGASKLKKFYKV